MQTRSRPTGRSWRISLIFLISLAMETRRGFFSGFLREIRPPRRQGEAAVSGIPRYYSGHFSGGDNVNATKRPATSRGSRTSGSSFRRSGSRAVLFFEKLLKSCAKSGVGSAQFPSCVYRRDATFPCSSCICLSRELRLLVLQQGRK